MLRQLAVALLSREHALITGPPGTAKSALIGDILGRVVDDRTGTPSVFSKQFTENTVQTDLVGPINFKTLMDTGRTEHFTDEGMLGAVHAFLDEVLDGRDMLLRSTLNVLHERELKQGTTITRGAIECAMMTSNRYPVEVLEGSRDTLLAFLDRVAYVSFVPRGFAESDSLASIVRSQAGPGRRRALTARLTLQDLDELQAAADTLVLPPALCDCVAQLVLDLESEFASARRADPEFMPTRYLSARTTVRVSRALKAIAVYRAVVEQRPIPRYVTADDFALLYLPLCLCGPTPSNVDVLLKAETDPRERRQLHILRTERQILSRCIGRLQLPPAAEQSEAQTKLVQKYAQQFDQADASTEQLLTAARGLAAASAGHNESAVEEQVARALETFSWKSLQAGATAVLAHEEVQQAVQEMGALADQLAASADHLGPRAQWLRSKAVRLIDDTVGHQPSALGQGLDEQLKGDTEPAELSDRRLARIASLSDARQQLLKAGGQVLDVAASRAAWQSAMEMLEAELASLWDDALRARLQLLRDVSAGAWNLAALMGALREIVEAMESTLRKLDVLRNDHGLAAPARDLKNRVVGHRVAPILRAAFDSFDASERRLVVEQVVQLHTQLRDVGLGHAIEPRQLLQWSARALLRAEPDGERGTQAPTYDGYLALRTSEERTSLAYVLVELATRVVPNADLTPDAETGVLARIAQQLTGDEALTARLVDVDLARVERSVALLEAFWEREQQGFASPAMDAEAALRQLAASRFFHITADQQALERFRMEAELVRALFAGAAERCDALVQRMQSLQQQSRQGLQDLHRGRSDAAWQQLLESVTQP